jgi:hypothetical protein
MFTIRFATLLVAMASAMLLAGPVSSEAAQLTLDWVDNSGGEAAFSIERRAGTAGAYTEIAQQSPGVATYVDAAVIWGTTYCYRLRAFDGALFSEYSNEACASPAGGLNLSVVKEGTAAGTVASTPVGIDCGVDCSETYAPGTLVTLSATPAGGMVFTGWSSGGCSGNQPCTVAGTGSLVVRGAFADVSSTVSLGLSFSGSANGSVTSTVWGIDCQSTCSGMYAPGTVVVLTAAPVAGARFKAWGGACSGTATTCTVTVDAQTSVVATFTPTFTNDPVLVRSTPIKAVHFAELRTAVNTVRSRFGLPAPSYTDPEIVPAVTPVRRVHVLQLRTALNEAYQAAARALPAYTDNGLTAGQTPIAAVHLDELRAAVRALE